MDDSNLTAEEMAGNDSKHIGGFLTEREVREKLISRGVGALTDAELLSVIIEKSGDGDSLESARKVLEYGAGSLVKLSNMGLRGLRMAGGLGVRRAVVVAAALELGKRLASEELSAPTTISTNEDVVKIFRQQLAGLGHEEFWVLYLSSANTVLEKSKISQGGSSSISVDYKIIVKRAVELLASSIILVHNHPSGISAPSEEDKSLTSKIITAASLFDINVLDHLIITQAECFSFRQGGLIK